MAVNRFDQPAQYNPIDTYVPLPLKELMAGIEYKQKQGEAADLGALTLGEKKLGETLQYVDIPGVGRIDVSDKSKHASANLQMGEFEKEIDDLINYSGDPSDPMRRRKINALQNKLGSFLSPQGEGGQAMQRAKEWRHLEKSMADAQAGNQPWRADPIREEMERFQEKGGPLNMSVAPLSKFDVAKYADERLQGIMKNTIGTSNPVEYQGYFAQLEREQQFIEVDRIRAATKAAMEGGEPRTHLDAMYKSKKAEALRNKATEEEAEQIGQQARDEMYQDWEDYVVNKYTMNSDVSRLSISSGQFGENTNKTGIPSTVPWPVSNAEPVDTFNVNSTLEDYNKAKENLTKTPHITLYQDPTDPDYIKFESDFESRNLGLHMKNDKEFKRKKEIAFKEWKGVRLEAERQERFEKAEKQLLENFDKFAENFEPSVGWAALRGARDIESMSKIYNSVIEDVKTQGGVKIGIPIGKYSEDLLTKTGNDISISSIDIMETGVVNLLEDEGADELKTQTGWRREELQNALLNGGILMDGTTKTNFRVIPHGPVTNSRTPGTFRFQLTDKRPNRDKNRKVKYIDVIPSSEYQITMGGTHEVANQVSRGIKGEPIAIGWDEDSNETTIQSSPKFSILGGGSYIPRVIISNSATGEQIIKEGTEATAYMSRLYKKKYEAWGNSNYQGSGLLSFDKITKF